MTSKLKYLTQMSLNKKIKSKWFYVVNILICVLIIGIFNVDTIIKFFGGDFDNITKIIVSDNTNYIYNDFSTIFFESSSLLEDFNKVEINKIDKSISDVKDDLKDNDNYILLEIDNDINNIINARITTNKGIDTITYQLISSSLNQIKTSIALYQNGIDSNKLLEINNPVDIEKNIIDIDNSDDNSDILMGVVFPILILPVFMLIIILVQMIGTEINEEKSTKSMEIIISNVSPRIHFTSKLLAGNIFVFIQGLLIIIYAILGFLIRISYNSSDILSSTSFIGDIANSVISLDIINKLYVLIPLTLVIILITFVAYSLLAAILASMTTNMEDFQQLQTPIVIICLLGYYLAIMSSMFEGSTFIRIMSYVPFISALLSPSLLLVGQISVIDTCVSILLNLLVVYILYKYGIRIYKVGILNYSSSNLWKKIFKSIKDK